MSSLESNTTDEQEKKQTQQNEEHDNLRSVGWKALFSFTTRQHLPVLSAAIVFGTIAALTLPALAIMYGLVFRQFADYGTGKITGKVLLHNASRVCTIMTGISALNWIANSVYFSMFLTFGELQANSARNKIFGALLLREMEWYDTRKSGTAAFLPAVQM
jgi:ATP-binding cassette subfamily B (MDR/TAP) protein 1